MKKEYRKPLIISQNQLEQASLACNLRQTPPFGFGEECDNPNVSTYAKDGNWMERLGCSSVLFQSGGGPPGGGCGPGGPDSGGPVAGEGEGGVGVLIS